MVSSYEDFEPNFCIKLYSLSLNPTSPTNQKITQFIIITTLESLYK
jgi:hypothetical protein